MLSIYMYYYKGILKSTYIIMTSVIYVYFLFIYLYINVTNCIHQLIICKYIYMNATLYTVLNVDFVQTCMRTFNSYIGLHCSHVHTVPLEPLSHPLAVAQHRDMVTDWHLLSDGGAHLKLW